MLLPIQKAFVTYEDAVNLALVFKIHFISVPADDVFTSVKREKSFACRIKCTMSHGGGFYKVSTKICLFAWSHMSFFALRP